MRRIIYRFIFLLWFCFFGTTAFSQSNRKIDSLITVLKTAKEDTGKVNTLNSLSIRLREIAKYIDARNYAQDALTLAEKLNFKKGMGSAYNNIGNTYLNQGNYVEARKNYLAYLKICEETGDKKGIGTAYNNIGVTYKNEGNYGEAMKNYLASLNIRKEIEDKKGIADCYNNIGLIHSEQGNYKEALKNHLISLKIKEEIGDKLGLAGSYSNIGKVNASQDNYPEALKNSLAALKIREEIGDKQGITISYNNIGVIYAQQGNYGEALKNFLAALKIKEEIGDKYGIASCYINLGSLHLRHSNYPEALKHNLASLKICEEIGDKQGIAISYSNIGAIYTKLDNYPEALNNHLASLKIKEEIGDQYGIAKSYVNLGILNIKLNKAAEAKKHLYDGLALSKKIGSKELIKDAYNSLALLDSAIGNYQQAFVYYKLYTNYKDSILNEANNKQITQMKEQYESEKKDKEIVQLTSEKQKLESEKQISGLLLKTKQDSLNIVQVEKDKVQLENDKVKLENEKVQALNLYNGQQIELLGNEKKLQQLQIEKDQATYALQKTEVDRKQEQLVVLGKEKNIQALQLKKQKQAKNYILAGLTLLVLLSFFVYRNFQTQRKLNKLYRISAEKQMAELQLQSLRAQLNPHFMFNSLNAIQELIVMEENEKSQSYLERFAQLLRQLLDNANEPFIPLRKEINFLELYLSLERLRLPDLKYSITIDPEVKAENITIPNMMLQPYIENALWHGLQHKHGEKKLQLHISRQNGSVQYEIRDNGVGRKKSGELKSLYRKEHRSKGMELLSQRFDLLSQEYGQNIITNVTDLTENGKATGTLVQITVPSALSEHDKINSA